MSKCILFVQILLQPQLNLHKKTNRSEYNENNNHVTRIHSFLYWPDIKLTLPVPY